MKVQVLFVKPAADHWIPRLLAGGVDAVAGTPPTVNADGSVLGLPAQQDGVFLLVNARVAQSMQGGGRTDLRTLPQGAAQDGTPIDLDFLVKV